MLETAKAKGERELVIGVKPELDAPVARSYLPVVPLPKLATQRLFPDTANPVGILRPFGETKSARDVPVVASYALMELVPEFATYKVCACKKLKLNRKRQTTIPVRTIR